MQHNKFSRTLKTLSSNSVSREKRVNRQMSQQSRVNERKETEKTYLFFEKSFYFLKKIQLSSQKPIALKPFEL